MEPRPLLAGDPAQVGPYRVAGRLGQGGQGVVYLGESAAGERVAIKLLTHATGDEGRAGFAKEIELARRVKAFCTATVLATGELNGVPYVISEYVDGPSLARVLAERGPLRPAELRRLAIGSLTALTAIHQAGVVHRDLKPGNVLLGRDGPRVIDFGISRALDSSELTGEHLVGTPPYMAPEQFGGAGAGPPADLFAWAATVVCAASGKPPFGSGDLPSVLNRILSAEPDLGDLRGDLRDLVARCLAKDPAARPTAARALLTLLGHPVPPQGLLTEGTRSAAPPTPARLTGASPTTAPPAAASPSATPSGGSQSESPSVPHSVPPASGVPSVPSGPSPSTLVPGRRSGRRVALIGTAAVLVAAAAVAVTIKQAGTTVLGATGTGTPGTSVTGTGAPRTEAPGTGAPATAQTVGPSSTSSGAATADDVMPTTSTTTVKIPGTKITLHENPADPVWVSSAYGTAQQGEGSPAYVRDAKTGKFQYFGNFQQPTVSPHGAYVAALSVTTLSRTDYNTIRLVTPATGEDVELRTADKPGDTMDARWNADGRHLLMTLFARKPGSLNMAGFVIVDAATKSVRSRLTTGGRKGGYSWGPDASTLMRQEADGAIAFVGLDGTVIRTFRDKGDLMNVGTATVRIGTGTATVFATVCPGTLKGTCLWDATTGARRAVIPSDESTVFNGWLDSEHFLATVTKAGTTRLVLADLNGKTQRVLAEGPATELKAVTLWYSRARA
ncbi:serine/threonine-protein kinase [Nonomuraea sp. NPDC048901]|uniref:serine/threonine-protein kinase n=1 Tax=Nonomuraea sp. NPDC048901 TaxID=3155627 RepID=UPI0033FA5886